MSKAVTIRWKACVIVCDGARALLFRNDGDAQIVNLTLIESIDEHHPPSRELGGDRPGRVYQSHGGSRSAVDEHDLHDQDEQRFLARLARRMEALVHEHVVDSLIVVAPPRALGVLRREFGPSVRAVVTAEVAKDLAKLPTDEIERHLAG